MFSIKNIKYGDGENITTCIIQVTFEHSNFNQWKRKNY